MKPDKAGEGRNEFFEVINKRMLELFRDPNLATDLLAVNLKRYGARGCAIWKRKWACLITRTRKAPLWILSTLPSFFARG